MSSQWNGMCHTNEIWLQIFIPQINIFNIYLTWFNLKNMLSFGHSVCWHLLLKPVKYIKLFFIFVMAYRHNLKTPFAFSIFIYVFNIIMYSCMYVCIFLLVIFSFHLVFSLVVWVKCVSLIIVKGWFRISYPGFWNCREFYNIHSEGICAN